MTQIKEACLASNYRDRHARLTTAALRRKRWKRKHPKHEAKLPLMTLCCVGYKN